MLGVFSSGSGTEFGQLGLDQLWCDGHHTGGGLSEGIRRRSITGEQRCRLDGQIDLLKNSVEMHLKP